MIVEITEKKDPLTGIKNVIGYIGAFFGPILGLLSASGMIKGLLAILTLNSILTEDSSTYILLNAASDGLFYFFPIVLGFSVASKMGMNPYLGAVIGGAISYPSLQNMEKVSFLGIDIGNISYANTVLPILIIVILVAPLEKKLLHILPDAVKGFLAPMITLIISVPLGFSIVGPIANYLAEMFSIGVTNLYSFSPIICCVVLAAVFPFVIMSGIHFGLITILMIDLIAGNANGLMPIIICTSIVQSAVLGVIWFKTKDKDVKSIALPATISGIFGITEPGLYGITLPNPKYLLITCLGCGVTGFVIGLNQVKSYITAGMGIPAVAGMINEEGFGNALNFIIAIVIGMVVAGIVTFLSYKDDVKVMVDSCDDE